MEYKANSLITKNNKVKYICLNLAFSLLNFLINGIFILDIPISLILFSNACPLLVN